MVKSKLVSVILSLVIAFGLWLYVVTVISPESEETFRNIEVTLQNEILLREQGLMIVENKNPRITLRISGNRTDLAKLNSDNITIIADVSRIYEAGTHKLNYTFSWPGDVSGSAISVEERSPSQITLVVENRISKNVDVVVEYLGALPNDDYILDKENAELDHRQITVTGPQSVIDQITQAKVQVDLNGRTESFSEELVYSLCDEAGEPVDVARVTTNVESVRLLLKIHRVKEIPLTYTVVNGGGATDRTSSIQVEPKTIRVSGSESQLENLTELNLGTIHLGKILEDTALTFDIVLPEDVNNETGIIKAQVEIKFPELLVRTMTVTDIRPMNVPQNVSLDMITEALEITVRGPKDLVKDMEESDVIVMVDLAEVSAGTSTVAAEITFTNAYSEVGAVGSYSVTISLEQVTPLEGE